MESQKIEYVIKGFGIRGYNYYKDKWNVRTHRKNQVLTCQITDFGGVGIHLKGTLIGNMSTELSQDIKLKQFLTKFDRKTEIQARVTENEPRKGEVACDFYLKGDDTAEIREFLENVEEEINKKGKQRAGVSCRQIKGAGFKKTTATRNKDPNKTKSVTAYILFIKDKSVEITVQLKQMPNATFKDRAKMQADMWKSLDPQSKKVYEEKAQKENAKLRKEQAKNNASTNNKPTSSGSAKGKGPGKVKGSKSNIHQASTNNKPTSSGSANGKGPGKVKASKSNIHQESTNNKPTKSVSPKGKGPGKVKSSKSNSHQVNRGGDETDSRLLAENVHLNGSLEPSCNILLTEQDLTNISKHIGSNWKPLGYQLGLTTVKMEHIEKDNRDKTDGQIREMLVKWRLQNTKVATLCNFQKAVRACIEVSFDQPALDDLLESIIDGYEKNKGSVHECKLRRTPQSSCDTVNQNKPAQKTNTTNERKSDGPGEKVPKKLATDESRQKLKEKNGTLADIRFTTATEKIKEDGDFISTKRNAFTMLKAEASVAAADSVCKIVHPSGCGTGFRVGSRYIMTAAHVTIGFPKDVQSSREMYAIFKYKKDGTYTKEDIYYFREVVYSDHEIDIAVIELKDHPCGMPREFQHFCLPILDRDFFLIGHSEGNVMEIDTLAEPVDIDTSENEDTIEKVKMASQKLTGRSYDANDTLCSPNRFLFHCKFTKGASGCPGVVLIEEILYVTTVLLRGYPDWYYETNMERFKESWPKNCCVEQGVNLQSVRQRMSVKHQNLSEEIFGAYLQ